MNRLLARFGPFLVLSGAVAVLCFERLMNREYPLPSPLSTGADLAGYFYPAVAYMRSAFARGAIPLWNPYQYAGAPFLAAHQPAVLYPPLVMWLWLPPPLAVAAHALFHVLLAGLLTYGFARSIGMRASAALSAGLAYMLSYAVLESVFNTAYLSSYVWLPGLLWGAHETLARPRAAAVFLLAVSIAFGILSGHAQAFFYSAEIAFIYAVVLMLVRRPGRGALAASAGATVLGACVACAQLAMTAELAGTATRTFAGISATAAGAGFLLDMLVEGLTGGRDAQWATLSVLTIPLALAALSHGRVRLHAVFFAVMGLLLFDFLRGNDGYVYPAYYHLPFSNLFRIPARAAFAYAFSAAMLIGIGADAVLYRLERHPRAFLVAALLLPALVAIDAYRRGEVPVRYLPLTNPDLLDPPENVVEFAFNRAQYDRLFLERDIPSRTQYNFGETREVFVVPYYEPLLPAEYRDFFGVPTTRLWPGGLTLAGAWGPDTIADPKLLDLLSVRYYMDVRASRQASAQELEHAIGGKRVPESEVPVYERDSALPRAYVVHRLVEAPSSEAALQSVRALDFDPRSTAVVEGAAPAPEPPVAGEWEYARIVGYEAQHVELEVRCASKCLAVLTDLYYPGWRAHVDGDPVDTLRTNYLVRGVLVPSGTHRVTFVYVPPRWRIAAIVSLIAAVALLAVGLRAAMSALR